SNISTGNPAKCASPSKFYVQTINHDNQNGSYLDTNSTFLQQYQLIDTYYKPGGPIFFQQMAESPMTCVEDTHIPEWAKEVGALIVALEHRYFGLSCPYGLNYTERSSWKPGVLKPLTLENVLGDGVGFVSWVKQVAYPAARDAKV